MPVLLISGVGQGSRNHQFASLLLIGGCLFCKITYGSFFPRGIPMPRTKSGWNPQVTRAVEWRVLLDLGKNSAVPGSPSPEIRQTSDKSWAHVWESISHHPQTMISHHKNDESAPDLISYSTNDKQLSLLPSHLFKNSHALWCLRYVFILYIIFFIYETFTDCILYGNFWYSCEQKYLYEVFIFIFTWFRLVIALEPTWSYSVNYDHENRRWSFHMITPALKLSILIFSP